MLSSRIKNTQEGLCLSPVKPKIVKRKLPADFFEHGVSLEIRKSSELNKIVSARDAGTPKFGRRRPSPLNLDRKILTAL